IWLGTSMATPHVTGLAALLKAQDQTRDWKAIRNLILSTGDASSSLHDTVTGKRINAERALTAPSDARLFAVLNPADSGMTGKLYALYSPIDIEVHDISVADPAGPVTCTINNTVINLLDDGIFPDKVAGDGVFTARWTPPRVGEFSLVVQSGFDGQNTAVNVSVWPMPPRYTISEIPHSFNDISTTGWRLYMEDEDIRFIPFPATVYGWPSSGLYVNDNGNVSVDTWPDWENWPLPTNPLIGYGNVIAPFWDDLDPPSGDDVYVEIQGPLGNQTLTIQWNDVPHWNLWPSTNGITFQAIFHENNPDIEFRYQDVEFGDLSYDSARSATVGIQGFVGSELNATQFSYNTPSLKNNYSLQLTASELAYPLLSVEPDYLYFGYVLKTKSNDQPVYVYNKGNIPLTLTSLAINGSSEYTLVTKLPYGGLQIPAGEYRKVIVRYRPVNDGVDYASLMVRSTAGICALSVYGAGMSAADIDLSGGMINFGEVTVGDSYEQEVTIRNNGNAGLRIDNIDVQPPFSIPGALPPYIVAPGSSITLTLSFSPESEGSFSYPMAIFSNDPDEPAVVVPLAGSGSTLWP
ncbi:MAG: choice-of-anchor D domain-containing protein, partial [bacterium]